MQDVITDAAKLLAELQLTEEQVGWSREAARHFQCRVPRSFLRRMRVGDPHDPLLRQVLPTVEETRPQPGLLADAVGDLESTRGAGVLHKYNGRALLITTGACAVNCRYCFRRNFPYSEHSATRANWEPALEYLRQERSLHEVILSGGDPLSLSDHRLIGLIRKLDAIPHLKTLRIHTRIPVVQPEQVSEKLVGALAGLEMKVVVVMHANHARELGPDSAAAITRLRDAGTILLNQSVLLRGINDGVSVLEALSYRLLQINVLPYYLHIPDAVTGTSHFQVSRQEAIHLMEELGTRLPGYLMPRLASEEPGRLAKTHIGWTPARAASHRGIE